MVGDEQAIVIRDLGDRSTSAEADVKTANITFDCADPDRISAFRAEVLGYEKGVLPRCARELCRFQARFWDGGRGRLYRVAFQAVTEPDPRASPSVSTSATACGALVYGRARHMAS